MGSRNTPISIITKIRHNSGLRAEESKLAYVSVIDAISQELREGKEVFLPGVGKLCFYMAKPRKVPRRASFKSGTIIPAQDLPERPVLKLKLKQEFKKELKGIVPEKVHRHQRWSTERKAGMRANQSQTPGETAAPSTPSDTEPAARLGLEDNIRSQTPSHETDGNASAPSLQLDNTRSGTSGPAEYPLGPTREIGVTPVRCEQLLRSSREVPAPPPEAP